MFGKKKAPTDLKAPEMFPAAISADQPYGGFWIRGLALGVDGAILFGVIVVVGSLATLLAGPALGSLVFAVLFLLSMLYFPIMHASAGQATIGKAMLGMKVTDYAGNRISMLRSFGRFFGTYISNLIFCLGYLIAAFTPRKQALHDFIASTYVVRVGPARILPAFGVSVGAFFVPLVAMLMLLPPETMDMLAAATKGEAPPPAQQPSTPAPQAAKSKPAAVSPPPPATVASPAAPASSPAPAGSQSPQASPAAPVTVATAPSSAAPTGSAGARAAIPLPQIAQSSGNTASPPASPPAPLSEQKPAGAAKSKPAAPRAPSVASAARPPAAGPAPGASAAAGVPPAGTPPVELKSPRYNDLMTAVHRRDAAAVQELLTFGRWPDKRDSQGDTPLIAAVESGETRIAELLLIGGANPNLAGAGGKTAAVIARQRADGAMLGLLDRYGAR